MNEPLLPLPIGVRTRMVLHLLPNTDRLALQRELTELPDTLLLFLKKLKKLTISAILPGQPVRVQIYSLIENGNNRKCITKADSLENPMIRYYWITRRQVQDMPADSTRINVTDTEVVLAFPLDSEDHPVIDEQYAFAFLPLRKVGYKVCGPAIGIGMA